MGSVPNEARMTLLEQQQEAYNYAMELASATVLPRTLRTAIELNIFEIISRIGSGAENPDAAVMVDRILRLLASYSILTCSVVDDDNGRVRRRYGLARSYGELVLLKELSSAGGNPFNKLYGMSLFEYLATDPRFNKVFNVAMSNHSTITMKSMLEIYRGFDGLWVLVDVGGGIDANLNMIISKHPSIKGINFNLPHVVADAPSFPGVEHVGGDMFASVPSGNAIFMKWILHDRSDENCLKVLKNCWKPLPEQGKVIVMEGILPGTPETTRKAQGLFHMDLIMLVQTPGRKERTEKDFESLAQGAGFSGFAKLSTSFGLWIMEFTK
ncbi:unnamed protein product [Spirodela intermedia]|uniref:Uncharacterized protein n=1 Tax=Spirodela intermedia TaxID=51605 RepID=A0A7I8IEQ1_SPIIN|nr:unnamed protein product [Spirodela intermedia]CAA6656101.1 unnamed protein product [Spirodela intermedia]